MRPELGVDHARLQRNALGFTAAAQGAAIDVIDRVRRDPAAML
jgi:hypothetical protein